MELGLYTFADVPADSGANRSNDTQQRIADLMEEIKLADEVGLDVFGIGEHHRPDYAVSSPATILAAAAVVTKNIRLSSAVTVLSSDDPVRVFQQFATIDHLSGGRAEIMVGRGSFIESFPLFGYDLEDYDSLFKEKLQLLIQINEQEKVASNGMHRPSIPNLGIYPRPYQQQLPIWLAVGGTPSSAVRAATLGLPMAVAIIGGMPQSFVPFVKMYKETLLKGGSTQPPQVGINSFAYVAETADKVVEEFFPSWSRMMNKLGKERGWPPVSRQQFDAVLSPSGSLIAGSVQQVIDKILYQHQLFQNTRFLAQMSIGDMPHKYVMQSIELFGTKVAPEVRKHLSKT